MTKNSDINISKVYSNQCLLSKEDFLKIYNIKDKLEYLEEIVVLTKKEWENGEITKAKLKEKIMEGLSLYELADFFNVDTQYMHNCILFYVEKYGMFI